MSNDKDFKVKNGIQPTVYHESLGTIATGSVAVGYTDASLWAYSSKSFSVTSQETDPAGFAFKSDGTKMYLIGRTNDTVYQYSLSTAWDVSTSSYDSVSFLASSQATNPACLIFKPDGTKMYILDYGNDDLFQYSLSTAWDISTASYDSVLFDPSAQETTPRDFRFNADGTKIFLIGSTSDTVHQYSLSTAYDVGTASYDSVSFSVAGQTTFPGGIDFNADASKMYIFNYYNGIMLQYSLPSAYDIANATYDSVSFTITQDTTFSRFRFSNDGTSLYVAGTGSDTVYQYTTGSTLTTNTLDLSTGSVFEITPTSNIQVGLSNPAASGTVSQATLLLDGVAEGYDLSGAAYDSVSFSVAGQNTDPTEVAFNGDGTKMYMMGLTGGCTIYQYSLSSAFDVSTASYDSVSFSVNSQSPYSYGFSFNDDGTKIYVLGNTGSIYQYSLSTAFDLSTASYDSVSFNAGSQDVNTYAIKFNSAGTKMYISGAGAPASIYQYSLSSAFDLSTASYDSVSFNVSSQETSPYGLVFKSDGTKMYVSGFSSDSVHQYSLSSAFDLSTASYDNLSFSFASQATFHYSLTLSADGTKMHILSSTDTIYQYTTGSAYTVTYDSAIQFGGGTAPDSPLANETDVLSFSTRDGGTSYQAMQAIDGAK